MKQKYCFIEWVDACMWGNDQVSRKKASEDSPLAHGFVCGFLIHEDKEKVVVGMDWFDKDDQFRVVNTYPKTGIKKLIIKDFPIEPYEKTKTK